MTVLITMLISTSLLCLSPTNASSATTVSMSSLCWAQIPLLPTKRMCFEDMSVFWMLMGRCVDRWHFLSAHLYFLFSPRRVFFNHTVSRLLLSVAAAGGAPLSDTDADQRAMGGLGAGRAIRACKIPYTHRLEVRTWIALTYMFR